jgi:uncharacterized Zn-binding protein involved in type VI secretion
MADFLVQVGATLMCPHTGSVATLSSNTRVLLGGQPASTLGDAFPIAGCTLSNPCVKVQWLQPASQVRVNGQPVILRTSTGVCQSGAQSPQGSPLVVVTQQRVRGT